MSDIKKVPAREEIELRAYEIYLERGGKEGNAVDDWLALRLAKYRRSEHSGHGCLLVASSTEPFRIT
jgi:Protein of unknown function (DUF2934)